MIERIYKVLDKIYTLRNFPMKEIIQLMRAFIKIKLGYETTQEERFLIDVFDLVLSMNGYVDTIDRKLVVLQLQNNNSDKFKICFRRNGSDIDVCKQILLREEYAPLVGLIRREKNEIKYVIDAGANIGLTTIFLKKYFPSAIIISLEPEIGNFQMLQQNIRINEFNDMIPLKAGLWKSDSFLELKQDFRDGKNWSFYLSEIESHAEAIEALSIVSLIDKYGWPYIDILKIDIEGGERFIFEDNTYSKEFLPLVKFLAIEIHDEFGIREKILEQLIDNHFSYFEQGELIIATNTKNF